MSPVMLLAPVALAAPVAGSGSVALIQSGSDPAPLRAAEPIGNSATWLRASDFPATAFARSSQLAFMIRLAIDQAGRISDCAFDPALGPADPALVARACSLIRQRGRFRYAIDDTGQPIASTVDFSLWFAAGDERDYAGPPPAPPSPPPGGVGAARPTLRDRGVLALPVDRSTYPNDLARAIVDVDAKGRVTRCRLLRSTGSDPGDVALCRRLREARFEPARRDGKRIAYPGMILTLERTR